MDIRGEITVEDTTLSVSDYAIYAIFGKGTAFLYITKPDDLADRFFELQDLKITYDSKRNSVITLSHK